MEKAHIDSILGILLMVIFILLVSSNRYFHLLSFPPFLFGYHNNNNNNKPSDIPQLDLGRLMCKQTFPGEVGRLFTLDCRLKILFGYHIIKNWFGIEICALCSSFHVWKILNISGDIDKWAISRTTN